MRALLLLLAAGLLAARGQEDPYEAAQALAQQSRTHEAVALLEPLAPHSRRAADSLAVNRAHLLTQQGRFEEAFELLVPLAAADDGEHRGVALLEWAMLSWRFGQGAEGVKALQALLAAEPADAHGTRAYVGFQLFKLLERAERFGDAWAALEAANEAWRRANPGREAAFDARWMPYFAYMQRMYTRDHLARAARSRSASQLPVFIVGLPRSGTSLLEAVLSMHPDVFAAEELTLWDRTVRNIHDDHETAEKLFGRTLSPQFLTELADWYDAQLRERAGADVLRVTTKLPFDFFNLGLVSLVYPQAKIVRLVRDPRDVRVSLYAALFNGEQVDFSYDRRRIDAFIAAYDALVAHWAAVGIDMLEVRYEDLVRDVEGQARRVLEHVGLPFHPACLEFHKSSRVVTTNSNEAVREPAHSRSVGRWRRYPQW